MPIYEYKCRTCGVEIEIDRLLTEDTRHIRENDGYVCGTLRRLYSSINVNTTNLRAARR